MAIFVILVLLFSHATWVSPSLAKEVIVHMDPEGSDKADGLTAETPVATLQEAVRIAEQVSAKEAFSIRIAVAPGEYKGQSVTSRGQSAVNTIAVTSADPSKPRPRFDGDGKGGTWFELKSISRNRTHYTIEGLEVMNYETAINLAGDRNQTDRSNGENEIRNNIFSHIGQIARVDAPPSTAVIRLVNSDNNVIQHNHFTNIKNTERCALLHSIYIAHDSTGNVIEDNIFEDSCGDAIRFRDGSHANLVKDNSFIDAWAKAPISDWYCDREKRDDCTKATGECPSMNNVLDNNRVIARKLKPAPPFLTFGDDIHSHCSRYPNETRFVIK